MSYQKSRNGYLVQVYYRKEDGSQAKLSKRVKKFSEVAEARRELEDRVANYQKNDVTFDKLIDEYVDWLKANRRLTTAQNAEKKLRVHILPFFKGKRVCDLSYSMVVKWKAKINEMVSQKSGENISLVYKRNLYTAFHGLMSFALKVYGIENNALNRAGNFISDPNARPEEQKLHYWTVEQFKSFSDAMISMIDEGMEKEGTAYDVQEAHGIYGFFNILFYAGLRRGEANALQVDDFHDGEHPYLNITKSVNMKNKVKGKYLVTLPKNKQSIRKVPIPSKLAELIRFQIDYLKMNKDFQNNWFLCGGRNPIPDTTADVMKNEAEKRANLPHIRVHDLRHSYASMLINKGVDIAIISRLMGHGSPQITYSIYSHFYPETNYKAVEGIDDELELNTKKEKEEEEMEM